MDEAFITTALLLTAIFLLQDLSTGESGLLQVTLEGIGLKFVTRRVSCTCTFALNSFVRSFLCFIICYIFLFVGAY